MKAVILYIQEVLNYYTTSGSCSQTFVGRSNSLYLYLAAVLSEYVTIDLSPAPRSPDATMLA